MEKQDFYKNQTFESALVLKQFLKKLSDAGHGYSMLKANYLTKNNAQKDRLKYSSICLLCKQSSIHNAHAPCPAYAELKAKDHLLQVVQCVNVHNHGNPPLILKGLQISRAKQFIL